jgi:lactate dehydrogenase-like 2-hydroxyacid dehydrogenase
MTDPIVNPLAAPSLADAHPSARPELLQLAAFPADVQAQIDADFHGRGLDDLARTPALAEGITGIITRSNQRFPAGLVERLPNLRIISTFGVGYDQIPVELAAQRGIVVTNTPDVLNAAVAELAVAMLLALLRQLPRADRFVREGRWQHAAFPLAVSLAGKRIGIVGLGRIGKEIANRLAPFGVALAYHGRTDQQLAWRFEPDLVALAAGSDVLIVTAPGGGDTAGMIDARVLATLGPQGYLVNVARGSLVDEAALIEALQRRTIAGAALDVFDNEPAIDERLLQLDNVMLTPHIGSATHETRAAMAQLTLDNLRTFFREGRVLTPVLIER